jgi:hypothetical protein
MTPKHIMLVMAMALTVQVNAQPYPVGHTAITREQQQDATYDLLIPWLAFALKNDAAPGRNSTTRCNRPSESPTSRIASCQG